MTKLSDMLCYLRSREGLTQQELADATGMTRSAISMYETGKREPKLEDLEIIADYYNIDMNTLTGNTEDLPPNTREVVVGDGIRILFDADANMSDEQIKEISEFIKFKRRTERD